MNPLKSKQYNKLFNNGYRDLADKVNEIVKHLNMKTQKQIQAEEDIVPVLKPNQWEEDYANEIKDFLEAKRISYVCAKRIKQFIQSLLDAQKEGVVEDFKVAFFKTMYGFSQNTFDKTLKGKFSGFEVKDKDWQDCSFTFLEAWEKIDKLIKGL